MVVAVVVAVAHVVVVVAAVVAAVHVAGPSKTGPPENKVRDKSRNRFNQNMEGQKDRKCDSMREEHVKKKNGRRA